MQDAPLILTNLGNVPKIGLIGDQVVDWLSQRGIEVPTDIFGARRTSDDGWIVRSGICEWLIEKGPKGDVVGPLQQQLKDKVPGVYPSSRDHTTLLLGGPKAPDVFAQTCALDLRNTEAERVLYTIVAGVHCAILPESETAGGNYRLWVDPSYAHYLWGILSEIVRELGGEAVFIGSRLEADTCEIGDGMRSPSTSTLAVEHRGFA